MDQKQVEGLLTKAEAQALRRLLPKIDSLLEHITIIERRTWLFNTLRTWAIWLLALFLAVRGGPELLKTLIKGLL